MTAIRVLIADDHVYARVGTATLLQATEEIEVVGEAADGRQAVDLARDLRPHVVVMDLIMPGMDGAEATRQILDAQPGTRVVVLTSTHIEELILDALRSGALGYTSKEAGIETLVEAIRRAHRGEPTLPVDLTRRLLRPQPESGPSAVAEALTPRETEVLRLVARGWSNEQVGERIGVARTTVRSHLHNLLGKLGLRNRIEATLFALAEGLTTLEECRHGRRR